MKNKLKENKAITLIALIITIIVLLILAGIVLNLVLGENGVLRKANWSSFTTEYSQIQESSNLYYMNKKLDDYGSKSKLASQTPINTNGKNKKEYYAIKENGNRIVDFEDSLTETIQEMEGITDINEAELYELDLDKINYKGKNEYIVNVKSGRVYRYDGFNYEKKIYHVPELAMEKNGLQIKIANEQVIGDYQFWKTSGAKVEVSFDIELPDELKDGQVTVEKPELATAVIEGSYNTDTSQYTGTITTNELNNPNGSYVYKITVEKDGEKYEKSNNVNVNKFLDDPTIEVPEESKKWNELKIKVTNNYPNEANISYKYYISETDTYSTADFSTADTEVTKSELKAKTQYNIKVEAYLGETHRDATLQTTTLEKLTEIRYIEDLEAISEDLSGSYKLMNDLDFKERSSYRTNEKYNYYNQDTDEDGNLDNSWIPLGTYTGTFDGQYYSIKNLYINNYIYYAGLFSDSNGATIKNLYLKNVNVTNISQHAGGLIAYGRNTIIQRVSVEGTIDSSSSSGGIIGYSDGGLIEECYSNCNITHYSPAGGIAGWGAENIQNCYSVGIVNSSSYYYSGGITGYGGNGNNCYSLAKTNSYWGRHGPLTSNCDYGNWYTKFTNSYWCEKTSNSTTSYIDAGTKVDYEDLFKQSTYQNWDFDNIWQIKEGETTPYLKWMGDPPEEVKKVNIDKTLSDN